MTRFSAYPTTIALAMLLMIPAAQAVTMAKADEKSASTRISADYKTEKAACGGLKANAKDICVQQAKSKEKVARAELKFAVTGTASDGDKVKVAKAEAAYAVAKETCDDQSGNAKDVCVKEAKAVEVKALADAKLGQTVGKARLDAAQDKRDADFNVAIEKCDALTADAKSSCITKAKATFGKS